MAEIFPQNPFDLVIPVFNEAENLPLLFSRLEKLLLKANIIFVDNGSTDGSLQLLKAFSGAHIISHVHNEGYGASIKDGIEAGKNSHIVIMDADCEYPPECIPDLLQAMEHHEIVYASRFLQSAAGTMPWLKAKGNQMVSEAFNILFHQQVTDLYTGCKALRRQCLKNIKLEQPGFEHVLELSAKLAVQGYRIHEIPVKFSPRQNGQSKMRHVAETAKFFYWLLQYRYQLKGSQL